MGERLDDDGEKRRGRGGDESTSALLKYGGPDPLYIFMARSGYKNGLESTMARRKASGIATPERAGCARWKAGSSSAHGLSASLL